MRERWEVIWDAENIPHVEEHGLTLDEVESVLLDASIPKQSSRNGHKRPIKIGYLADGRKIIVVWEVLLQRPFTVHPITAYEIN